MKVENRIATWEHAGREISVHKSQAPSKAENAKFKKRISAAFGVIALIFTITFLCGVKPGLGFRNLSVGANLGCAFPLMIVTGALFGRAYENQQYETKYLEAAQTKEQARRPEDG